VSAGDADPRQVRFDHAPDPPAVGDDAGAHAHRVERAAVALCLSVHRHHTHRRGERVVVALEPAPLGAALRFVFAAALVPNPPTICTGLASSLVAR
jgi:hypothetical protein